MEDLLYYSDLYDLYKGLLTDKQKQYFEDYYFNNLSFSEISENYNVSRNAIYNQVRITKELLEKYEDVLKLKSKYERIEELLDNDKKSKKIREIINSWGVKILWVN